ncbi:CRISPR-associated protein Cas4 [Anaerotignum sp. MSJ-24]|uniref:CRISPR-associated protein Cas4 n=1 Tax=Anaerotignum sp. MSJ-24 TaxID=2841521 RepID=UPI0020A2288D|nr:CRISPR-associated protein Cas4 [Anaerotignum sp. MSJ-24]
MYNEDEFLQLSGIQHFAFCRRQWALIHIEMQWKENLRTVEGQILHENAHNPEMNEKRGNVIVVRAMPVHSRKMGVSGECDVVEFHKSDKGAHINGREGVYMPVPVEYKRGEPKSNNIDILQLAAQALCLEEMFCTDINYGYIYYGETRHRLKVDFDDEIRNEVVKLFEEMHLYYRRGYTPKVKISKKCNACSLKDLCVPVLNKNKSVAEYIDKFISETGE